jgi:hypothetical protein
MAERETETEKKEREWINARTKTFSWQPLIGCCPKQKTCPHAIVERIHWIQYEGSQGVVSHTGTF